MKRLLFLFLLSPFFSTAQDKPLLSEGISPGLYLTHKVASKENYYSIGRIYNISPKEIAPFNNLELESGLSLGQVIKIPLSAANFFQNGTAAADEIFVPVYHTVKGKEGLYRVAVNHNNLPLETLKQWNNIKGDAVKNGTKLIIGYLKVKSELSGLSKKGIGTSINSNTVATVKPQETKTAAPKTITATVEKKETVKPKTDESVQLNNKAETDVVKPESKKTAKNKKVAEGGFKNIYESQISNAETIQAEGTAGIFKSTSGWADKKYYCLQNNANAGTIIKITNTANDKFVFAKVLDLMPDIKQNEGLLLIISNAAAEELGAADGNFKCLIKYSK